MHMQKWPNSIASQYMRATGATGDYNTMTSIIRQRGAGGNTPSPHTVVVHTRIGDVLDMDMAHVGNVDVGAVLGGYAPGQLSHYTYPLSHYQGLIGQLPGDVNHVVFCGGCQFNHGGSFPKSADYINALGRWFVSKGFSVDYKMGRSA